MKCKGAGMIIHQKSFKHIFLFVFISPFFAPTPLVLAQIQTDSKDPYFQITEVKSEIKIEPEQPLNDDVIETAHLQFLENIPSPKTESDSSLTHHPFFQIPQEIGPLVIMPIFNFLWDLVVNNKPVVNVERKNASALPNLAQADWRVLTGWKPERAMKYNLLVTNGFKMKVIDFSYDLRLLAGGRVRGAGYYIASARVVPQIIALWGYHLNVKVEIPKIENINTDEDPLASMDINIVSKVDNTFSTQTYTQSFRVQGNGLIQNIKTGETYFEPYGTKKIQ